MNHNSISVLYIKNSKLLFSHLSSALQPHSIWLNFYDATQTIIFHSLYVPDLFLQSNKFNWKERNVLFQKHTKSETYLAPLERCIQLLYLRQAALVASSSVATTKWEAQRWGQIYLSTEWPLHDGPWSNEKRKHKLCCIIYIWKMLQS